MPSRPGCVMFILSLLFITSSNSLTLTTAHKISSLEASDITVGWTIVLYITNLGLILGISYNPLNQQDYSLSTQQVVTPMHCLVWPRNKTKFQPSLILFIKKFRGAHPEMLRTYSWFFTLRSILVESGYWVLRIEPRSASYLQSKFHTGKLSLRAPAFPNFKDRKCMPH